MELQAKSARVENLKNTPKEEFSSAKEKSALSIELDQIIFELNKSSEGMRRHYESDNEPRLSDYFPELGYTKNYGNMEILDGSNEDAKECA